MPDQPITEVRDRLRRYLASHDVPCERCGYNLRGLADDRCPECGRVIDCQPLFGPVSARGAHIFILEDRRFYLVLNILIAAGCLAAVFRAIDQPWQGGAPRALPWLIERPRRFLLLEYVVAFLPIVAWYRLETSSGAAEVLGYPMTDRIVRAAPYLCAGLTLAHLVALVWLLVFA